MTDFTLRTKIDNCGFNTLNRKNYSGFERVLTQSISQIVQDFRKFDIMEGNFD